MIYSSFFKTTFIILFIFIIDPKVFWGPEKAGGAVENVFVFVYKNQATGILFSILIESFGQILIIYLFYHNVNFQLFAKADKSQLPLFPDEACPGFVQIINLIFKSQQISEDFQTFLRLTCHILFFSFRIVGTSYLQQIGILD